MKSLLDPSFKYVPSLQTDLRKTFARIRREQLGTVKATTRAPAPNDRNVTSLFMTAKRAIN